MPKKSSVKMHSSRTYTVKAAESRASRVPAKASGRTHAPSHSDKELAQKLIRRRAS